VWVRPTQGERGCGKLAGAGRPRASSEVTGCNRGLSQGHSWDSMKWAGGICRCSGGDGVGLGGLHASHRQWQERGCGRAEARLPPQAQQQQCVPRLEASFLRAGQYRHAVLLLLKGAASALLVSRGYQISRRSKGAQPCHSALTCFLFG
jgi:hypothetical protein